MKIAVGDRIVVRGHGEHDRDGEVLEVRGPDGRESLIRPGTDAFVQHSESV